MADLDAIRKLAEKKLAETTWDRDWTCPNDDCCTRLSAKDTFCRCGTVRPLTDHDGELLARALLKLMPFVDHDLCCASNERISVGDENVVEIVCPPCDCGLNAALREIGDANG